MSETKRQTLEQGRAEYAFKCAEEAKEKLKDKAKEYKSYAKKLPMLIKTNGLGAALAFAFAKGSKGGVPDPKNAWGLLYIHIEEWTRQDIKELVHFEKNRLVAQLLKEKSPTYRAVTIELMAFLGWLKRFVDGLIEGEGDNS